MDFYSFLQKHLDDLDSVYDLFSFGYHFLMKTVGKFGEADFISKYVWTNSKAEKENPNLKELRFFSDNVGKILLKQENDGISFENCLALLEKEVKQITDSLRVFGEPFMNDATIPMFILYAIDRYMEERCERCTEPAPLNKRWDEQCYIYLKEESSILESAVKALNFPKQVKELSVCNQFRHLLIIEKEHLPDGVNPPRMVSLSVGEKDKFRNWKQHNKTWKIAVIPFDRQSMIEKDYEGASYCIKYRENHLQQGKDRAIRLLEKAIDAGANMIVFPEYVCFPEMQKSIQDHLQSLYEKDKQRLQKLFLVVAGSGWYEENNNIACIYSYSGKLIGKQYKYERYHNLCDGAFHDENESADAMAENLSSPGKEVTFVRIRGVGVCMTAICRDIPGRTYLYKLAEIFSPTFLVIPAWSPSVKIGFKEPLKEIIARNHRTTSVLCNCCEAVSSRKTKAFKKDVGIVVTPYKEKSDVVGKDKPILRSRKKCDSICEKEGCVYLIRMNFSIDAVKKGEIVQAIEQF